MNYARITLKMYHYRIETCYEYIIQTSKKFWTLLPEFKVVTTSEI